MIPRDSDHFTISSNPSGADVFVMGQKLGVTPLEVSKDQVFPTTYANGLENKYGRIELRHADCEPYEKPVSGHILASGLKAKLQCATQTSAPVAQTSAQERLRQLKAIFDEGLISEEEYQAKRQSILRDL